MKALNSVFARAVKSVPAAHPVGGGQILSVPLQWNGGGVTRAKIAKVLGVLTPERKKYGKKRTHAGNWRQTEKSIIGKVS